MTTGNDGKGCPSDMGGYGGAASYLHTIVPIIIPTALPTASPSVLPNSTNSGTTGNTGIVPEEALTLLLIVGGGVGLNGWGGSGGGLTAGDGYATTDTIAAGI